MYAESSGLNSLRAGDDIFLNFLISVIRSDMTGCVRSRIIVVKVTSSIPSPAYVIGDSHRDAELFTRASAETSHETSAHQYNLHYIKSFE